MAGENLDRVRQGHAGFNRGDPEVVINLCTPDVEWVTTGSFPGMREVYRGPDAIRKWTETLRNAWTEFEVWVEEVIRDEDDRLVVAEVLRGCGRESGAWVEMRIYTVYWFEDGKVRRREACTEREIALEAAESDAPSAEAGSAADAEEDSSVPETSPAQRRR
jgi:ketosteroid isomerase-like protein